MLQSQLDMLNERLSFYMNAFNETSKEFQDTCEQKDKLNLQVTTEFKNILDETVPKPLNEQGVSSLEVLFHTNLDDVVDKHHKMSQDRKTEIEVLTNDSCYQERLSLVINDDLKLVKKMESDEVFKYLISQLYGTDKFVNEPSIHILGFHFQPRAWKFQEIADKNAKEFGMNSFEEMHQLWTDLRINYKSLEDSLTIEAAIAKADEIEEQLKRLKEENANTDTLLRNDIIETVIDRVSIDQLDLSQVSFANLKPLKQQLKSVSEKCTQLQSQKDVILTNMQTVEKMIALDKKGHLRINPEKMEDFMANTLPERPIFEMIDEEEWKDIERALNQKGISTSQRENYTVIKRTITTEEKISILKRHNVKEGEIFIDPKLSKKSR